MTDMTVVRTTAEVPLDQLLGYISFQNIEDMKIHKEDLGQLFDDHGLPRTFLPHEIKPHDAFRRASSTAARTIEIDDGSGNKQHARLLVREVAHDDKRILRHLVREIVDGKNEVLDYATVGKMEYDRTNKVMNIGWAPAYVGEYAYNTLLNDTQDLFMEWTEFHTKDTVRNIVNRVISSTNPVSIQKGGRATFIPKGSKDLLLALKSCVAQLPGGLSQIDVLPLIDTQDTRDLVARRAEDTIQDEINELLSGFTHILSGGTVTNGVLKRYIGKFQLLQERTKEYQMLVRKSLEAVNLQVQESLRRVAETPLSEDGDPIEDVLTEVTV